MRTADKPDIIDFMGEYSMNLLSARRLYSYLLPTEHPNPHLGDHSVSHVSYTKTREYKEEKESHTPPLSFLQYLLLLTTPTPALAFSVPLELLAGSSTLHSRPTE